MESKSKYNIIIINYPRDALMGRRTETAGQAGLI